MHNYNPSQSLFEKFLRLHWGLISLICLIAIVGFVILYSAAQGNFDPWANRQMIRFGIFFVGMIIVAMFPIYFWFRHAYHIYGIALVGLVLIEFAGTTVMGATRWLSIAGVNIQPSEIMKLCLILALSRYFHRLHIQDIGKFSVLFPPLLMIAFPFLLIVRQPDLGTGLILVAVGGGMFFVAGVRLWKFAAVIASGLAAIPLIWQMLHDYQKKRVLTFLNPESDPLGSGYNILQSKIAIGSGGVSGKGFLKGSQSQLSFLPEKQTDFIFTMFAEEFGLIGSVLLLLLYSIIIGVGIFISLQSHNHYGRMVAMGVTLLFFLHMFINVAMVMGLIPVVGAPLPLLSYGGTIMMTILIGFGFLLNVHVHNGERIDRYA